MLLPLIALAAAEEGESLAQGFASRFFLDFLQIFEGAFLYCFGNGLSITPQAKKRGYADESGERSCEHFLVAKNQDAIGVFGREIMSAGDVLFPRRELFNEWGESKLFEASGENIFSSCVIVIGDQRVAPVAINIDELWVELITRVMRFDKPAAFARVQRIGGLVDAGNVVLDVAESDLLIRSYQIGHKKTEPRIARPRIGDNKHIITTNSDPGQRSLLQTFWRTNLHSFGLILAKNAAGAIHDLR